MSACGGSGGGQPTGGIHARFGYSEGGGLRVVDVPPGGAAGLAGLEIDDVILAINGEPIRTLPYQEIVERLRPNSVLIENVPDMALGHEMIVLRAMIGGMLACWMTASVASLFI